jgi:uncharacterized protein (UPF0335 family)
MARQARTVKAESSPKKAGAPRKSASTRRAPASTGNTVRRLPRDPQLEAFTEALVKKATERRNLLDDMTELYGEARDKGYDTKVMRRTVKILCETAEQRSERERVQDEADEMLHRLGHLSDTPLGRAAITAAEGRSPQPEPPEETIDLEKVGRESGFDDMSEHHLPN